MTDTLTYTFDRRADEYVDGAFSASFRMQGTSHGGWLPSKRLLFWMAVVFLVVLGALRLAEIGGFHPNTIFLFVIGAMFGFIAMLISIIGSQRSLAKRMKAVVREGSDVVTMFSEDGVRSKDEVADIGTAWDQAHMIWIERNTLHIMTDMFIHIVPERALPSGQSLEQLQQTVFAMRDDYLRKQAQ